MQFHKGKRIPKKIRRIMHENKLKSKELGRIIFKRPAQRFFRMKPVGSDDFKGRVNSLSISEFNGLKRIKNTYFEIHKGKVQKIK